MSSRVPRPRFADAVWSVRREVARASRADQELAMVLLRLPEPVWFRGSARAFASRASRLLRGSDAVIPYDDRHVAVLLPDTELSGAERVVERIADARGTRAADASNPFIVAVSSERQLEETVAEFLRGSR